eukprot:TRINITY_DN304_c0_g1_i3.p2 TRINITY_DN304_c0_g1~~TRINITY_DN304_c0_g1_i3.p2  ORF type:complete len:352 (+),score=152.45 TRINITY_DN304_c0_g1_i3:120-1175(+)
MFALQALGKGLARGSVRGGFPSALPSAAALFSRATARAPAGLARAAVRMHSTGPVPRMPLTSSAPPRGGAMLRAPSRANSGGSGSGAGSGSAFGGLPRNALLIVGGASAVGLLLNAASGFASGDAAGADGFDTTTRKRLTATYLYVAGGLGATAAAAVALFRAGVPRMMAARPFVFLGLSVVATMGSSMLLHSIDYGSTVPKHLAWLVFNGAIAASLCPLVAVAPVILLNAAAATAAMVGGLSLLAASAPSESFLWMRGPLSVGLGVMFAASIGGAFFPGVPLLYNFVLYGGLALFGGFVLYDTSATIQRAKVTPPGYYDPINNSQRIYMNVVQIFIRMVMILQNGGNRKK